MEYLDTFYHASSELQQNFDPSRDAQSNTDFDLLNLTVSNCDSSQVRLEDFRKEATQPRVMELSLDSSFQRDQTKYGQADEKSAKEKGLLRLNTKDCGSVKRRRGPNKNQKVLTEEERKKKKAKALCRNAESARTCRGKRKQAEEKLKIQSANIEREFQILCRTREALSQELFDLLELARSIKDPLIIQAIDQASVRLSLSMTHGRRMQEDLDVGLQHMPPDPLILSRRNSDSLILQSTPTIEHNSPAILEFPPASSHQLDVENVNPERYSQQKPKNRANAGSPRLRIDVPTSTRILCKKKSPPKNDSEVNTLCTPISIRRISLAQEDEGAITQHKLAHSPNSFTEDRASQEEFGPTQIMELLPHENTSFMGSQPNLEQRAWSYVFSPSPMPQFNEPPSNPFEGHLFMQPTPPSLDTPDINQQSFDFPFPHPLPDQGPLSLSNEDCVISDLETAIAQLVNFA
ncbi:hypothetical protein GcM1_244125 [Golovinomyces cichoracearum]|uniref:BZIP domain-containing protein n=1 Tax=Golovinomyces cichoracearum TaxID=62708 RepID=A0A420IG38_9PEZI|nr:hypothetical protein GcM1_244125 [Golovinomyces cichoracearum]